MILLELFFEFFKVGLFAVGGGMATLPFLYDLAEKGWYAPEFVSTMLAISESTPGPIAINCATFTGYKVAGFCGALVATLGMIIPSFFVIFFIAMFLDNFLSFRFSNIILILIAAVISLSIFVINDMVKGNGGTSK